MIDEKIDIHHIVPRYKNALDALQRNRRIIPKNKQLILKFLRDCELGKTIKNRSKKSIAPPRLMKYLIELQMISKWLGKPFDKVKQKDMESFILSLENDKLRRKDGKCYSIRTKVDFKNDIRKFYKWLLGNNERYPDIVAWIDTYFKEEEIPALNRKEVEQLIENTPSITNKAIISVLFDSGARIEELLNVRLKDLAKMDEYYKMRIKYSKTKPRTVSLTLAFKQLEQWLGSHPNRNDPDAPLFPQTYAAIRKMINRLGNKILHKRVTPHMLRHSSATYYCSRINWAQLCYRFGWAFSSKMAQRYIDREGIPEQDTPKIIKSDEISIFRKENKELQENVTQLKVDYDEMREIMEKMNRFMTPLAKNQKFLKQLEKL